jgi:hypothetical protein
MTLVVWSSFGAIVSLLGFWFYSHPDGWRALMEIEMERGLSYEEARLRNGWWRLGSLALAVVNGVIAATS